MYRKILIAYNGTPESRCALHACIRLAPGSEVEVHLLGVINLATYLMAGEFVAESAITSEKALLEQELTKGHKLLSDVGLNVITHFESGEPINVISDLVTQLGIDLVIIAHSRKKPLALPKAALTIPARRIRRAAHSSNNWRISKARASVSLSGQAWRPARAPRLSYVRATISSRRKIYTAAPTVCFRVY